MKGNPLLSSGFVNAAEITREHAKTFYFSSRFLPKEKKYAAYAIYAICRISDESVDKQSGFNSTHRLAQIKKDIESAYSQAHLDNPILIAFKETVKKYKVPKEYFDYLLEGMNMDLNKNRYLNFQELYDYCFRVAGAVGLIMAQIFGYKKNEAKGFAADLGIAMQLTNILRDIKEDYRRGRIYLPKEEMKRYNVSEENIAQERTNENFTNLLKFQIARARDYYKKSSSGIRLISDLNSRFVVLAMKEIYAQILNSIERNNYDVFSKRAVVNSYDKVGIALKILIRGEYLW